jgi:hypothetical protein
MGASVYVWPNSGDHDFVLRATQDGDAVCINARNTKGDVVARIVYQVGDTAYAKRMADAIENAHNSVMAEREERAAAKLAEEQARIVLERQMNEKEEAACLRLFETQPHNAASYDEFRRFFRWDGLNGCWMGMINGVVFGIEADGYAHQ